jgi:hypothetical protein
VEYVRDEQDNLDDWGPLIGLVMILGCALITGSTIALVVVWMFSWSLEMWLRAAACALLVLGSGMLGLGLYRMELLSRQSRRAGRR